MFCIKEISPEECYQLIVNNHYSQVMPRLTKYWLGCYYYDKLIGCVTLGWGTQPLQTIQKILGKEFTTQDYLEIGKMCCLDEMPRNTETQMLKEVKQYIKYYIPQCKFLYTLADGIMGKCGYVYQAFNFYHIGDFWTDVYIDNGTGEKIHPRSAKELLKENAEFNNVNKVFWLTHNFCEYKNISRIRGKMFRYMLPLNKRFKKYVVDLAQPYPKQDSLVWKKRVDNRKYIEVPMPNFNMQCYNYNSKNVARFAQKS